MPWRVERSDKCPASQPWAVIDEQSGEIESCHATRKAARRQRSTLTASASTPDGAPDRETPFYERRGFQGAAAVVALVGALMAVVGAPKLWDVVADLFSPSDLPHSNTEIILDASSRMSEPFGDNEGFTKLAGAGSAVGDYAAPFANEGLALRRVGGECDGAGELLVDFAEDNADEVEAAAAEQPANGEANLAKTVIAAIDDFADAERFPEPDSPRRVVLFTGGADNCPGDGRGEVCNEVERTGVDFEFQLVGLKVNEEDRKLLRSWETCLGEQAVVEFVETPAQLDATVEDLRAAEGGPTGETGAQEPG